MNEQLVLSESLERALAVRVRTNLQRVAGGSISDAWRCETERGPIFLKTCPRAAEEMLAGEADGLDALAEAGAVRVPRVVATGFTEAQAWLALDWIDFGEATRDAQHRLGLSLAKLHSIPRLRHGWRRDNTIGSTPQPNAWSDDWVSFLRERRIGFQLELALSRGAAPRVIEQGRRLCERLGDFFATYRPVPSLLHGDLWGGNWGVTASGEPVIFDPAVYCGDREADIAMTRLFGGFDANFYAAYEDIWPLDGDAHVRADLYNLYHVLNHYNLFGGGYLAQAQALIDRLLAQARG